MFEVQKIHTREATDSDSLVRRGLVFGKDRDRCKQCRKTKNEDGHEERPWGQNEHHSEAGMFNTRDRKIGCIEGKKFSMG